MKLNWKKQTCNQIKKSNTSRYRTCCRNSKVVCYSRVSQDINRSSILIKSSFFKKKLKMSFWFLQNFFFLPARSVVSTSINIKFIKICSRNRRWLSANISSTCNGSNIICCKLNRITTWFWPLWINEKFRNHRSQFRITRRRTIEITNSLFKKKVKKRKTWKKK